MADTAKEMARQLALQLLEREWKPRHLLPGQVGDIGQLLQFALEESIALRDAGNAALSLEVLVALENVGLYNPWITDNQARALVDLGQRQSAYGLWQTLLADDDPAVVSNAQQMLALQEESLRNALGSICAREGWVPRHLQHGGDLSILERALQEIIDAREANAAQLSLDLAVETLNQGWSNPWLLDNQARALVHLGREPEALAIWQGLQDHDDDNLANTAREMVALYQKRVEQQELQRRCNELVNEGQAELAQQLLLDSLIRAPGSEELRRTLAGLLHQPGSDLLSQELHGREADLAVHERLLDALEERLSLPRR